MFKKLVYLFILYLSPSCYLWATDSLSVLPEYLNGQPPTKMMSIYLNNIAEQFFTRWSDEFERRLITGNFLTYQHKLQNEFLIRIGGLPERTLLQATVTGVIKRHGYQVEKVIFSSQPHHYVTALFFLPDSLKWSYPVPGVLIPCGHSANGKASKSYQSLAALLALEGIATLVYDPIDQGERGQILDEKQHIRFPKAIGHTMAGIPSILLGRNTARFRIWDGMRAIDYLASRPEVDTDRIGCTGNSGGGTLTAYLMALDDRIKVAVPSCYITKFDVLLKTRGPQDAEQNIFGQIALGMDQTDYLMMRAPIPIMISAATQDFFDITGTWDSFRYAKRYYERLGYSERIAINEHYAPHGYHKAMREAAVQWLVRWLYHRDTKISEPHITLLSEKECQCTPQGQVMLLKDALSIYDLNRHFEILCARDREKTKSSCDSESFRNRVRMRTGIHALSCLEIPHIEYLETVEWSYARLKKCIIHPEPDIYLPALLFEPKTNPKSVVLYVHQDGKHIHAQSGGPIEKLVKSGHVVLAVDLRGSGETQPQRQFHFEDIIGGQGAQDVLTAYLLEKNYVGMRANDVLTCALWLKSLYRKLDLQIVSCGNVGVPVLHAAALEPHLFKHIHISRCLISWSNIITCGWSKNQLINTVHGALKEYDLDILAQLVGQKLTIEWPVDAKGQELYVSK